MADEEGGAATLEPAAGGAAASTASAAENGNVSSGSEDDEPVLPSRGSRGGGVKKGSECPFLDSISRQVGLAAGLVILSLQHPPVL